MAITTQVTDPSTGGCCDCSKQVGCSCGPPTCELTCQSRTSPTGTAAFCGLAQFIPTNPPEYFYMLTLGGSGQTVCYGNAGCTGATTPASWAYSGAVMINKNTCVQTSTGMLTVSGGGGPYARNDVSAADITAGSVSFSATDQYTATTHQVVVAANPCVCNASGFACCPAPSNGDWESELGDQETYDDAIARAVAGQPWSAPGDCQKNSSVTTELDEAGQRIFAFQQAQVQAVVTDPIPGHTYQVTILLLERSVGTDTPLVPYGQLEVTVTCPPTGPCASDYMAIPNVEGFVIVAASCTTVDTTQT
jgi:hypothetical protein